MKKASLLILVIATSFCLGFSFKSIISKQSNKQTTMKKVTGIGGIFFKCKDPNKIVIYVKSQYILLYNLRKVPLS